MNVKYLYFTNKFVLLVFTLIIPLYVNDIHKYLWLFGYVCV